MDKINCTNFDTEIKLVVNTEIKLILKSRLDFNPYFNQIFNKRDILF